MKFNKWLLGISAVAVMALTGCGTVPTPTVQATIKAFASEGTVIDLTASKNKDRPYFVAADTLLTGIESNNITVADLTTALSDSKLSSNSVPIVAVSLKNALDLISAQVGTNSQADVSAYVTPLQQGIDQGLNAVPPTATSP